MEAAATASGSRSPWDGFFWPPWGWCFLVCPSRPWVGEKGISKKTGQTAFPGCERRRQAPIGRDFSPAREPPKSLFKISRCAELAGIFLPRKAKNRRNTCCITRFFPGAKSRLRRLRLDAPAGAVTQRDEKRPAKAACREILNRLLHYTVRQFAKSIKTPLLSYSQRCFFYEKADFPFPSCQILSSVV